MATVTASVFRHAGASSVFGVELLRNNVGAVGGRHSAFFPSSSSSSFHGLGCRRRRGVAAGRGHVGCEAVEERGAFTVLEQLKASASPRYTRERCSLAVIGVSVHTTPVEIHEKLVIPEAQWPHAIQELCDLFHIEEAAVLSTCNRMEIYVVALSWHQGIREVTQWMAKRSGIPVSKLREHLYLLGDNDATCHLFEVAAGLDSLVLGEGQILSQVKQVVRNGSQQGGLGKYVDRLFKHAITCGKRVQCETNISSGVASVSSAAVELAFMKLPPSYCSSARMLVIGAGKMGKLVIKHLAAKGCKNMVVVNRSEERVAAIKEELKDVEIIYKPFSDMLSCADKADVIFTCTASEGPLFMNKNVEVLAPPSSSMDGIRIFIDISVPRNVESCVSKLETVRLFNVDDLKEVVEARKEHRLRKVQEAQTIIGEELKHFQAWSDSLETVPTIRKLKQHMDGIKDLELARCLQKIGDKALTGKLRKTVNELSNNLINKLLYGPLKQLRCDGDDDSQSLDDTLENMHALNRMFELDTKKAILEEKIKAKVEKVQKI